MPLLRDKNTCRFNRWSVPAAGTDVSYTNGDIFFSGGKKKCRKARSPIFQQPTNSKRFCTPHKKKVIRGRGHGHGSRKNAIILVLRHPQFHIAQIIPVYNETPTYWGRTSSRRQYRYDSINSVVLERFLDKNSHRRAPGTYRLLEHPTLGKTKTTPPPFCYAPPTCKQNNKTAAGHPRLDQPDSSQSISEAT